MKPGPANAVLSTHSANAGCANKAASIAVATSRGFFLSGFASCMAAVNAKSPWDATLGTSSTGTSVDSGATTDSAC